MELLRSFAYARGWVAASGLPDETRAGRRILKDYVDGKILYCKAPPGASPQVLALAAAAGQRHRPSGAAAAVGAAAPPPQRQQQLEDGFGQDGVAQQAAVAEAAPAHADSAGAVEATSGGSEGAAPQGGPVVLDLDEGDLLLMDDLDIGGRKAKAQRPAYKVSGRVAAGQDRATRSLGVRAGSFGLAGVAGVELVSGFPCLRLHPSTFCRSSTKRPCAARVIAAKRRSLGPCTMGRRLCRCAEGSRQE